MLLLEYKWSARKVKKTKTERVKEEAKAGCLILSYQNYL